MGERWRKGRPPHRRRSSSRPISGKFCRSRMNFTAVHYCLHMCTRLPACGTCPHSSWGFWGPWRLLVAVQVLLEITMATNVVALAPACNQSLSYYKAYLNSVEDITGRCGWSGSNVVCAISSLLLLSASTSAKLVHVTLPHQASGGGTDHLTVLCLIYTYGHTYVHMHILK